MNSAVLSLLLCLCAANGVLCMPQLETQLEVEKVEQEKEEAIRNQKKLERVGRLLLEVPLVDGHNDLPWTLKNLFDNALAPAELETNLIGNPDWLEQVVYTHTDIPRLRQGMVGGQFWSAYVGCDSQYRDSVRTFIEQSDVIKRMCQKYPKDFQFVTSASGILEAHSQGRIGGLIGVEGGHAIDSSLAVLRTLYDAGARYMTLTHNCNTPWADNAKAEDGQDNQVMEHDGLSKWGEIVVREMNRLGMLVDISHVAAQTMHRALDVTKAPVIFSHSSARALCNHTRNVPDDVLRRMKQNGGVVMVNFYPAFITCSKNATLADVVAHINHIRDVAGIDHVGIGGDYNGVTYLPTGLEDVSKYPDLFMALMDDPTWTDDDLKKLAGWNILRTLFQAERVRDDMKTQLAWDTPIPLKDIEGKRVCTAEKKEEKTANATEAPSPVVETPNEPKPAQVTDEQPVNNLAS